MAQHTRQYNRAVALDAEFTVKETEQLKWVYSTYWAPMFKTSCITAVQTSMWENFQVNLDKIYDQLNTLEPVQN